MSGVIGTGSGLDHDQLAQFEQDGIIGPLKLYEPEEMDERWHVIRRQLLDRSLAVYPAPANGGIGLGIHNYDRHLDIDLLSEHICHARVVDVLTSILGPDVICWRSEFFPKYAGDEGTDWHQEATFATGTGVSALEWPPLQDGGRFGGALTVWIAFTDATVENGCLQVVPGTHNVMYYDETKLMEFDGARVNALHKNGIKRGFYGYDYRDLQVDSDWRPDESRAVPLVMARGECVVFWSTLLHASLPHVGSKRDYRIGFGARYVPPFVSVYPGRTTLAEHGAEVPLDHHRSVLVAGVDSFGLNQLTTHNRRGYRFPTRHEAATTGCSGSHPLLTEGLR